MNKKGQFEIVFLVIEFVIVFILIKEFGSILYESTKGIPFGTLFRVFLPSPESTLIDYLKVFMDSFLITGGTAFFTKPKV